MKYNKEIEKRLKKLLYTGVTITQIAERFGVTRATVYSWMNKKSIKVEVERYKSYVENLFNS